MKTTTKLFGGTSVKRLTFIAVLAVFTLGLVGTAFAAAPNVIGANGASAWSYQDLKDSGAKYEGGYAVFGNTTTGLYTASPHGNYDTTTNKCKVCHAVHRAQGAYYMLRSDTQDDACSYCHIGGSAHSDKTVYNEAGGVYTSNGHTIGSSALIPDSSTNQVAQTVTLTAADANGNPIAEPIEVRTYDTTRLAMYRFSRHHGQAPIMSTTGFLKVGPLALNCLSCHNPHNASEMTWKPTKFSPTFADPAAQGYASYKLLKRYPSGATVGNSVLANGQYFYPASTAVAVPEASATAGVNYSENRSGETTYALPSDAVTARQPLWIAQKLGEEQAGTGPSEDPSTINQYALSYWCADCHNLDIGSAQKLANPELGFKAHSERTHPAPYVGAHGGPGQCYSCHRTDLAVSGGVADPVSPDGWSYGQGTTHRSLTGLVTGASNTCMQCHYGTGAYYVDRTTPGFNSDFPHSGGPNDIKLLGAYTAAPATTGTAKYVPSFYATTITASNLDAVCLRCHPGVGVHN
jgi:hypothetical protein